MMRALWHGYAVAVSILLGSMQTSTAATIDDLLRAYPDALAGFHANELIWRDGTAMPVSDGRPEKTTEEQLRIQT